MTHRQNNTSGTQKKQHLYNIDKTTLVKHRQPPKKIPVKHRQNNISETSTKQHLCNIDKTTSVKHLQNSNSEGQIKTSAT